MSTLFPSILLLSWSAVAATTLTGLVAAPLLGQRFADLALAPRAPRASHAAWLGLAAYPLAYGIAFATTGKATLVAGAVIGLAHAAGFALAALRAGGSRLVAASVRRMLLWIIYGAALGFAFVTP